MTDLKKDIIKNKYFIISVILLVILLIVFFIHLYLHIRSSYFPSYTKLNTEKQTLFYKQLKYIIFFILFLIFLTGLYIINPYNVITNYFGSVILISILIGTILITMLSWYNYAYNKEGNTSLTTNLNEKKTPPPINYFYKILLIILGGGFIGGLLFLFFYFVDPLNNTNKIVSLILNICIILIILALIYKIFNMNNNSSIFGFIKQIVGFIVPFIVGIFTSLVNGIKKETIYNTGIISSILLLLVVLLLFFMWVKIPFLKQKINTQGGNLLINRPINTNKKNIIASYEQLNGSNELNYEYAISFWLYINSYPPNTNYSYETFVPVLNYGDQINVLFNGKMNTLQITIKENGIIDKSNNLNELDANGNKIIYTKNNFLLQKWNNIIINVSSGALDIFLNSELVKSQLGPIPYKTLDILSVGSLNGIGGGICNLVYFNYPLKSSNIYYIYNMVKNKSPPIVDNSNDTIIKTITSLQN
jgi:hypothetical protein